MKKILLILDGRKYDRDAVCFAADVAKENGARLSVLLIQDTSVLHAQSEVRLLAGQMYVEEIVLTPEEQQQIEEEIGKNEALFHEECAQCGVVGHSVRAKGIPIDLVVRESRFSDMLVLSPLLTFADEKAVPTHFVTDVLTGAECPVLLAPEVYEAVKEIIVAYDGSKSAAFAIRQFAQVMAPYCNRLVKVLRITEEGGDKYDERDEVLFEDWMKFHFKDYSIISFVGNARDVLFNYFMEENENNYKLLVAGAFGRNAVSRFFKPGTTDLVLKAADIPVFIAHS